MGQEFDTKLLDFVKQKIFCPYEYMSGFVKFKEEFPSKEKFYSLLIGKRISYKEYEHLNVWDRFEMKTLNDYHNFYLKCDVLLLADVF